MKKTLFQQLSAAAALLALTAMTGCSAVGSAPTIAAETTTAAEAATEETTTQEASSVEATSSEAASSEAAADTATDGGHRLDDILARGYIEVATEPYFAPNEFIDPSKQGDEQYVGSDIELAHYIADKLGVECRIVPLEFSAVLTGITEGKYDLAISALAYTPARAEAMELSKGYRFDEDSATEYGLMIRTEDLENIKSADDLADKIVVCQSGSLQEMFAMEQIPACQELKRVSATTDGFLMVQEGKADAVVTEKNTAELFIAANAESEMVVVPDFSFVVDESTSGTRIGITKGETKLLDKINEIIDEVVESGQYVEWYEEYTEYAKGLGL